MDNRPIGVFDSGLGGLTTVRELRKQLPGEDIVYFGDTGRVPYGTKSRQTLVKYAGQDIRFLLQFDPKAIVVACNSADTVRSVVAPQFDLPILGVVESAARAAAAASVSGKIGLIATEATIRSKVYEPILQALRPEARLMKQACPLFVPLVENGRTQPGDPVLELLVAEYLTPLRDWGCDTLVLGCTHYPMLAGPISYVMGPDVTLVSSAEETALDVYRQLRASDQLRETERAPRHVFSQTAAGEGSTNFARLSRRFLGPTFDITASLPVVQA